MGEKPVDDGFDRFRHQALAPVVFCENKAEFSSFEIMQLGNLLLIIEFNAQRPDDFSLIFHGKGLFFADKHAEDPGGFFHGLVRFPAGHLTDPVNIGIFIQIR